MHLADTERVFEYKAAWERRAPADWPLRSVRAVAYAMAGHELHHLASVRRQHG